MKEDILTLFCDILKKDRQTLLDNFDRSDIWDSLLRVEVMFALEEEFGVRFPQETIKDLTTPKKMCDAVLKQAEEV